MGSNQSKTEKQNKNNQQQEKVQYFLFHGAGCGGSLSAV